MSRLYGLCALLALIVACSPPAEEPDMTPAPDVVEMDQTPDVTPPVDMPQDTSEDMAQDMVQDTEPDTPILTCNEAATTSGAIMGDTCDASGLSACVVNADCGDGERCERPDGKVISCCVKGLPGCKANEEACGSSFECEEGECVSLNGADESCTQRCDETHPCPDAIPKCNPILGLCTVE